METTITENYQTDQLDHSLVLLSAAMSHAE